MKIGDLFRRVNVAQTGVSPTGRPDSVDSGREVQQQSARAAASGSDDWVTISPEARQYARMSKIIADDEASRRDKVEEIKSRVQSGDYNVSSENVARSILSYSGRDS